MKNRAYRCANFSSAAFPPSMPITRTDPMRLHDAALLSLPFALVLAACKPTAETPKQQQTAQPAPVAEPETAPATEATPATEPTRPPETMDAEFPTLQLFFFHAEDGIRDGTVTGVQTCALPI